MALTPNRRRDQEHSHRVHRVIPEHTDKFDETLKASYWAHVARNFKAGDKIEAFWEDNSLYAEYLVLSVQEGGVGAKVANLSKTPLVSFDDGVFVDNGDKYKIEFGGNFHKFRIIRLSDGYVIGKEHKFNTELEARNYLHEHRKAMQANSVAAA